MNITTIKMYNELLYYIFLKTDFNLLYFLQVDCRIKIDTPMIYILVFNVLIIFYSRRLEYLPILVLTLFDFQALSINIGNHNVS